VVSGIFLNVDKFIINITFSWVYICFVEIKDVLWKMFIFQMFHISL